MIDQEKQLEREQVLRFWQIRAVAAGMIGVFVSLLGGVWRQFWLATGGLALFFLCLLAIFVLGVINWWRHG